MQEIAMFIYSPYASVYRKNCGKQYFLTRVEKDPEDKKDNPDEAPESGDKLPE